MHRSKPGNLVVLGLMIVCVLCLLCACDAYNPLIGSWKDLTEEGLTLSFTDESTFEISTDSGPIITGSYSLENDNTLTLTCDQAPLQAGAWNIKSNVLTLVLDNSQHQYQKLTDAGK